MYDKLGYSCFDMTSDHLDDELTIDGRFQLETDQIRQKKFIVVKPVNNPESASI